MSKPADVPLETTLRVKDECLCFHVQRTARTLARRFDDAFRAIGLTNSQFSLLMTLNSPVSPSMSVLSELLATDRTTLTAAFKTLARRGLVSIQQDPSDRRSRLFGLTDEGKAVLVRAVPIWEREQARAEADLGDDGSSLLRDHLGRLAGGVTDVRAA